MLIWSRTGRAAAWVVAALLSGIIFVFPMAIIVLASLAGQWNGILPSHLTLLNYVHALRGDEGAALRVSLITGVAASLLALLMGTCAALALREIGLVPRRLLTALFFIPSAVPSVSVGLGMLVAFSRPPVLLNGTVAIVIFAHLVLVSAFTFGTMSAGLARLPPDLEQIAESLGAKPGYRLRHVTLPLLMPYLIASFSLSFALSMGELGATVMIYPPGWVTLPVGIFALADRGDVFQAAALTVILAASTLLVLAGLSAIPARAAPR